MDTLNVTRMGDQGPTLVFLHGLMGRGKNFTGVAKELSKDFRMVLIDLPNHGESPWTHTFSYTDMAQAVAKEIELDAPVYLLGHSMGGKVAMTLALTQPELVDKLIIEDISPQAGGDMGEFVHLLGTLKKLDLDSLTSRAEAHERIAEDIPNESVRGFLLQNLRRSGDGFEWQPNLNLLFDSLKEIGDFPSIDATYERKVLWMVGENSAYGDPKFLPLVREYFPRAVRLVIRDAGHWLHSEQPQVFVDAVRAFFLAGDD
ncbi:alpha/beta fold hydrolase [uncultured Brevibacterium sp.]|uniref:alpha/beta fold hydrolase n=1 Tax=uncultured Brevibacterium sp. TaxID=189678 RepID=UPI0025EA0674|nr:alpha/beta fold hydrolase [uncultured Brevibacterium sp.]